MPTVEIREAAEHLMTSLGISVDLQDGFIYFELPSDAGLLPSAGRSSQSDGADVVTTTASRAPGPLHTLLPPVVRRGSPVIVTLGTPRRLTHLEAGVRSCRK